MTQDSIYKWTRRQPFCPFRLRLSTGPVYEFMHPDLILPFKREVAVGVPPQRPGQKTFERAQELSFVSYFHIVEIEPIPDEERDAPERPRRRR